MVHANDFHLYTTLRKTEPQCTLSMTVDDVNSFLNFCFKLKLNLHAVHFLYSGLFTQINFTSANFIIPEVVCNLEKLMRLK